MDINSIDRNIPMPDWIREMWAHYHRTGTWRGSDLRRVMGDQTIGVKFSSDPSVTLRRLTGSEF